MGAVPVLKDNTRALIREAEREKTPTHKPNPWHRWRGRFGIVVLFGLTVAGYVSALSVLHTFVNGASPIS